MEIAGASGPVSIGEHGGLACAQLAINFLRWRG
jgi:hypothetical protein